MPATQTTTTLSQYAINAIGRRRAWLVYADSILAHTSRGEHVHTAHAKAISAVERRAGVESHR